MVDLPSQPLGDIDPEFEKIALETGELTYSLSGTTMREKLLLNLANDICREHFGLAFRLHIQAALSRRAVRRCPRRGAFHGSVCRISGRR